MRKKIEWKWEEIENVNEGRLQTLRAKVIGGWLVKSITQDLKVKVMSESMVFIADRDFEWTIMPAAKELEAMKSTVKADDFASSK